VLAVEIKQYVGQGNVKALVPRVIGQTVEAQQKKSGGTPSRRQWDKASFLEDLETRRGADEANVARKILQWSESQDLYIWWGKGRYDGSFFPLVEYEGVWHWLISVWTDGRIETQFKMMKGKAPFDAETKRLELLGRLNELPGVDISADKITKRPSMPLSGLTDDASMAKFLETLDWMIEEIKAPSSESYLGA